ncbi:MAG: sigma-54-dependent Fis family transcriptional regulator [Candidatus Aenigmarchaeota archaeon]|nr:sigma-54-dependent Fis family transcriptional regulator [Candidatus Aenigmarchaeota archaeon]
MHIPTYEDIPPYRLIIGKTPVMKTIYRVSLKAARTSEPVTITGETGTGKELIARFIHKYSGREGFVPLSCAQIPAETLGNELFGHRQGAFTGAIKYYAGFFETANRGTLFLDEIQELPVAEQAGLLRVLQDGEYYMLGERTAKKTSARVLVASSADLRRAIAEKKLLEPLYRRIEVITVELPPLRSRRSDIAELADYFVKRYVPSFQPNASVNITQDGITALKDYDWPGNIRELESLIKRGLILAELGSSNEIIFDKTYIISLLYSMNGHGKPSLESFFDNASLEEIEMYKIWRCVDKTNGNKSEAARLLGISVKTIRYKLKEYESRKQDILLKYNLSISPSKDDYIDRYEMLNYLETLKTSSESSTPSMPDNSQGPEFAEPKIRPIPRRKQELLTYLRGHPDVTIPQLRNDARALYNALINHYHGNKSRALIDASAFMAESEKPMTGLELPAENVVSGPGTPK